MSKYRIEISDGVIKGRTWTETYEYPPTVAQVLETIFGRDGLSSGVAKNIVMLNGDSRLDSSDFGDQLSDGDCLSVTREKIANARMAS